MPANRPTKYPDVGTLDDAVLNQLYLSYLCLISGYRSLDAVPLYMQRRWVEVKNEYYRRSTDQFLASLTKDFS